MAFDPRGRAMIERHEGRKPRMYPDSKGLHTIGVGHNLDAKPITERAINVIYEDDLNDALDACERVFTAAGFAAIPLERQWALLDMAFQGVLLRSPRMIEAVRRGDWAGAVREALDGDWHVQVPSRAHEITEMLRTGRWQT